MSDYIEVDWYVCGVYQGKRKVGKNSICGRLMSGDFLDAFTGIGAMKTELDGLDCAVEVRPNKAINPTPDSGPLEQSSKSE